MNKETRLFILKLITSAFWFINILLAANTIKAGTASWIEYACLVLCVWFLFNDVKTLQKLTR